MGYYTNFQLEITPAVENDLQFFDEFRELTGYNWQRDYEMYDVKWYRWKDDMRDISKRYPDRLFQLDGQGEESDDLWRAFFKNGKSQICKARIVFDDFNEADLK